MRRPGAREPIAVCVAPNGLPIPLLGAGRPGEVVPVTRAAAGADDLFFDAHARRRDEAVQCPVSARSVEAQAEQSAVLPV